jgi:hypothetical protein
MTPAPLPPEEIERLETLDAAACSPAWDVCPVLEEWETADGIARVSIGGKEDLGDHWWTRQDAELVVAMRNALPALLAEIKTGRAGAERVRELERMLANAADWIEQIGYKATADLFRSDAAPRQAAQPSDLEREAAASLERQRTNTETVEAWAERMAPDFVESGNVIDQDAKGAQPAGRVEALVEQAKALLELDAEGTLVPRGVCGLARQIIEKFIAHHEAQGARDCDREGAWLGLRPAVRQRLSDAVNHLLRTGSLNREDIMRAGEVTAAQASADISQIMTRMPKLMIYDVSRKCYVRATPPTAGAVGDGEE